MCNRSGFTLLELSIVLALLGLLGMVGVGTAARAVGILECRAVREEVAGLVHLARAEARVRGEARVHFQDGGPVRLQVEGDSVVREVDPGRRRVHLRIAGARSEATLVFGPLGVGRVASATLHLERGRASVPLVISSHGRVRR